MTVAENRVRIQLSTGRDRSHDIVFADLGNIPSLLSELGLDTGSCLVVTDTNVAGLYLQPLTEALEESGQSVREIVIEPGERSKSFASYGDVLDRALDEPLDRTTPVLALGGGVVGDLAGFAAATLLRGLPLVQIPTSLVAQVDSAVGGKTGINHATGKNLIGSFYQPRIVIVDTGLLETLPEAEWMDGLSEVVKYGLIADVSFARYLFDHWEAVLARDRNVVQTLVRRCVEIKAYVVSNDETEQGIRAILNFGHTFGHALERVAGYKGLTHGQGVALGMRAALYLSALCYPEGEFSLASDLLERLPVVRVDATIDQLMEAMKTDKKRKADNLRFVVLEETGRAVVIDQVTEHGVRTSWMLGLFDGDALSDQ